MGSSYEAKPHEEIRGVMLHELSHAREGKSTRLLTMATLILNEWNVYLAIYNILLLSIAILPGDEWVPTAVYAMIFFNNVLCVPLLAKHRRSRELAADAYAVQHGSGPGLYSNLSLQGTVQPGPNKLGLLGLISASHPTTPYRLRRMARLGVEAPQPVAA